VAIKSPRWKSTICHWLSSRRLRAAALQSFSDRQIFKDEVVFGRNAQSLRHRCQQAIKWRVDPNHVPYPVHWPAGRLGGWIRNARSVLVWFCVRPFLTITPRRIRKDGFAWKMSSTGALGGHVYTEQRFQFFIGIGKGRYFTRSRQKSPKTWRLRFSAINSLANACFCGREGRHAD